MAIKEVDLLGDAIANTEREIFEEATGKQPSSKLNDDEVDRSLEEMGEGLEGQHEDDAESEEIEAKDGDEAEESDEGETRERDPETGQFVAKSEKEEKPETAKAETDETKTVAEPKGMVPSGRVREQTERANAAEARAKAAEEALAATNAATAKRFAEYDAKLEGFALATRQPPKPEVKVETPPKPDMFAQPEEYEKWMDARAAEREASLRNEFKQERVEDSMHAAAEVHGETFQKAYSDLVTRSRNGDQAAQAASRQIFNARNPGGALMKWHREQETLRVVGSDPSAWEAKKEAELRAKIENDPDFVKRVLEKARADASGANGGQPRHTTRVPSLNGAAGGKSAQRNDPAMFDGSERGIFESAFND